MIEADSYDNIEVYYNLPRVIMSSFLFYFLHILDVKQYSVYQYSGLRSKGMLFMVNQLPWLGLSRLIPTVQPHLNLCGVRLQYPGSCNLDLNTPF